MWLFLPFGFYSVVVDRTDADFVVVRTRDETSMRNLARFCAEVPAHRWMEFPALSNSIADYLWRVRLPRSVWGAILARTAEQMVATNVKEEIARKRPGLLGVAHRVYVTLLRSTWDESLRASEGIIFRWPEVPRS